MYGRTLVALLGLAGLLGCADARPQPPTEEASAPSAPGPLFDAAATGTLTGRVVWKGAIPDVPPIVHRPELLLPGSPRPTQYWPNPHTPRIDPASRGVADVVVFLRGMGPARSRAWDHPPVEVRLEDEQYHVVQGEARSPVGFVRRGDAVTIDSRDERLHIVHAEGAASFSLPFPDPNQPRVRRLREPGIVTLTSAAVRPWMRAYLFVVEHPYYARTDVTGRFMLPAIPSGDYELVAWRPDERIVRHERDPESSVVSRLIFAPPRESVQPVTVKSKSISEVIIETGD